MKKLIFIILVLLLGCGGGSQLAGIPMTDQTPLGFSVAIPESVFIHGIYFADGTTITNRDAIKIILLSWIDQRAREYEALRGKSISSFIGVTIVLYDNCNFKCDAYNSSYGYCGGLYDGGIIGASIYYSYSGLDNPPLYNYPPHTLIWNDRKQLWVSGIIPVNQIGIPILLHEWDEYFGIAIHSITANPKV